MTDDDAPEKTNVEVSRDTWRRLNELKQAPGDSFEDVISRLIDEHDDRET